MIRGAKPIAVLFAGWAIVALAVLIQRFGGSNRGAGGESPTLRLELSPAGPQSRERLAVRLEVINDTPNPVLWDREFSVYSTWRLRIDESLDVTPWDEAWGCRDKAQLWQVAGLPDGLLADTRFVVLKPGKRLAKEIELTKWHRQCGYSINFIETRPTLPGEPLFLGCFPVGGECQVRFIVPAMADPPEIKRIDVHVEYDPNSRKFPRWLEYPDGAVRPWGYKIVSNVVSLRLEN